MLWELNTSDSDSELSQDEDDETAPIASVYQLLEKYLALDNSQSDDS